MIMFCCGDAFALLKLGTQTCPTATFTRIRRTPHYFLSLILSIVMSFASAIAGRKPTLLLFVTLEILVIGTAWSQYRHSNFVVGKPKSHIPHAKFYG